MTRRLNPGERAYGDQRLAAAIDLAASRTDAVTMITDYAEPGIQCCWCDCDCGLDYVGHDPQACDGCPEDSAYVVYRVTLGEVDQIKLPMCERHYGDFQTDLIVRSFWSGTPLEVAADTLYDGA
ncbi:hypothetical protein ACXDF8_11535 [Mycolicibacterium sp. CBM1]